MKKNVVSFHYTVKNQTGEVLDSSIGGEPLSYIEGNQEILPELDTALKGLKVGAKKKVNLKPDQAYGEYDKSLVFEVERSKFPAKAKIEEGDQFNMGADSENTRQFTVKKITKTHVTVDGNHPLAGENLFFDIEVIKVRPVTAKELAHGHSHEGDKHSDH